VLPQQRDGQPEFTPGARDRRDSMDCGIGFAKLTWRLTNVFGREALLPVE